MTTGIQLKSIFVALFFFSLSFFTKIEASHFAGADISYQCLDHANEIYKIDVKIYRDCSGIPYSGPPGLSFCGTGSGCMSPTVLSPFNGIHILETTPLCPSQIGVPGVTTCSGGIIKGIEEHFWTTTISFSGIPATCTSYNLKLVESTRNGSINNILGAGGTSLVTYDTQIDRTLAICNNSPTFDNVPTPYFCSNSGANFFYSQSATDIDGDSLVYRIGECFDSGGPLCGAQTPVNWDFANGFSALQPFGTQYDITIDPNNGDMAVVKTGGGALDAILCVYVDEYRNGVKIGSIVRDMQFTFYDCGIQNPNPPVVDTVTLGYGGSGEVLSFQKEYCLGDTIDLNFCFTDADGENVGVSWDGGIPGASFTNVPPLTTTPCAPFHWDPSSFTYGPGTYTFLVTAEDDGCPNTQKFQRTMQITIYDTAITLNPQITTLGCNHKQFDVNLISGVPPYEFTWYIDGVFASNSAVFDSIFPGPGTHTYSIVTNSGTGCQSTDTGSFTVTGITAFAGNDTSICSGESIPLGAVGTAGVDYLWSPTTAVSDSAISNPTSVVFTNTGTTAYDTVLYLTAADTGAMGSGCLIVDSIVITVLPNPTISISALPGTNVCPGTDVTLTGSGTPVGSTYIWSTGDTATSITLNSLSVDTTIIAQAMVGSCLGDLDTITITMNPIPTATITNVALGDTFVCPGSAITINATSDIAGSTFQWSTGDVGSSINITPTTTDTMIVVTPTSPLTCAGTPDTVYIHHYPTVGSDFTADTVCLGLPTTFTDASTYSGVGGYTVEYDYGSGFTSTNTFTFATSGSHSVTMRTITNTGTCTTTVTKNIFVNPLPVPLIEGISNGSTSICLNDSITLHASGGQTYAWTWATGSTTGDSITVSPSSTTVYTLTTVDSNTCANAPANNASFTVNVNPLPTATITNVALGDTFVCAGSAITINATSDIAGSTFQWSTGDVGSSMNITPTTADTMIIVTPTAPTTCVGIPDTVYIHQIPSVVADFTADTVCLGLTTTFTDASTYSGVGGYTVEYDFGSGFTSANTFTFATSGIHSVTIRTITTTGNCTTTVSKNIFVNPLPTPLIEGLANGNTTICENDSVTLHASGGQTYTWTWATGSSTGDSITVSPSSTTVYTLTTVDSNTCANAPANSANFTVNVNLRPIATFVNPPASVCDGSDVPLQVNVTNGVTGGSFIWSFTGNTSSSETLTNLTSDTEVWVVPVGPAPTFCVGDTVKHTIVMDSLPNASFVTDTACPGFPTTFTSTSIVGGGSVSSVEWDFDNDAVFDATGTTVSNVMASSGLPVTIRVISAAGCTTVVTQNVPLHTPPTAAITPANSSDCVYNAANFSGTGSTATGTIVDYSWNFGDASTGNGLNVSHQYAAAGNYTVQLIVTDDNGCKDTTTTTYTVQPKPTADFNYTNVVCDGTPVTFTDASTGGTINSWQWDFDSDATIDATTQNPTFTYPGIGTYTITLIVGNTPGGCLDTITKTIDVQPIPVSSFTTTDVCDGSVVTFTNTTGTGTASWNFGDGGISNSQAGTVTHTYNNPGTFNVTLTTTLGSCVDTVIHPVTVHPVPVADFNPSATAICVNSTMVFTDASTISSGSVDSWHWSFGDGLTSSLQNPSHAYTSSGTYTVKLVVTSGPLGCADSITKTISVQDAPAAPTVIGDTICEGESASLIASGGSTYLWYSSATSTTPINNGSVFITSEIFNNTIFYVESVSSAGCTSPRTPVSVIVNKVDIDFYADSTELNIPDATTQFHSVSSSNITSYSWDFGDGGTSGDANPIHTYDNDGKYTVKLTVIDEFGCEKTITKTDYISVKEYLNLWIPNAFSPNGDGLNETFFIKGRLISTASIWIYDRWGGKVFEAIDNLDFEWNGKDMQNNDLPEGVYAYRIKYTVYSGETKEIKGTVTIIK